MTSTARIAVSTLPKGHEFTPASFVVDAERAAAYLRAVGDAGSYDGAVPPLAAVALGLAALQEQISLPEGSLHTSQEVEQTGEIRVDEPLTLSGRIAQRSAAHLARRAFGGDLGPVPEGVQVRMAEPLSWRALPDGSACDFYGAAYGELLRRVTGFEGAMLHDRCRGRGDEACVWRTAAAEVYE